MCLELEKLNKLYLDEKAKDENKYTYNNVRTIDNTSIDKEKYDMNVRYIFADDKYRIFVFIGTDNKLIFHGLYIERDTDLDDEYKVIKNDMISLSVSSFVKKYYEKLIKNF
jgi:hypothetical protein